MMRTTDLYNDMLREHGRLFSQVDASNQLRVLPNVCTWHLVFNNLKGMQLQLVALIFPDFCPICFSSLLAPYIYLQAQ
jgi:hypothetical protein